MVLPKKLMGKKPWSIVENKWFRMVVFPLCLLCTTVTYYGWQHMQMFLKEGDFLHYLCPPECLDDPGYCGGLNDDQVSSIATCRAQEVAWTTGYTIASSCEAGGSIFAGILFDHIGPLGTALIGQVMHYISWVVIINSNKSTGIWYTGMAINGLSVNLSAFPAFTLIDIFPDQRFIMTAVVLGGQVSATIVMPILHSVNDVIQVGGSTMIMGFLLCFALPTSIVYLLSLPLSHKHLVLEYERKGLEIASKEKPDWKVFGKCIITVESILFMVWYVVMIMQFNVFSSQLSEVAGDNVASLVGWMFFLQGPAAVLLGWFNDMTQTIPMCLVLTLMQVYTFGLVWSGETGGYIAGFMFVVANAHIYTTKFCYAAELYPPEHFGKVSGFFAFTAGILQFINTAIDAIGIDVATQFGVYMLLTIPQFLLLIYLGYRQFKKGYDYLLIGDPEAQADSRKLKAEERRQRRNAKAESANKPKIVASDESSSASDAEYRTPPYESASVSVAGIDADYMTLPIAPVISGMSFSDMMARGHTPADGKTLRITREHSL